MCFCLIYFILGNVSNCIEMYLGIFVNETKTETEDKGIHEKLSGGLHSNISSISKAISKNLLAKTSCGIVIFSIVICYKCEKVLFNKLRENDLTNHRIGNVLVTSASQFAIVFEAKSTRSLGHVYFEEKNVAFQCIDEILCNS